MSEVAEPLTYEFATRDGSRLVVTAGLSILKFSAIYDFIDVELSESIETVMDLDGWSISTNHLNTKGTGWFVLRSRANLIWRFPSVTCTCSTCNARREAERSK